MEQHSTVDHHFLRSPAENKPEKKEVQPKSKRGTQQRIPGLSIVGSHKTEMLFIYTTVLGLDKSAKS